VADDNTKKKKRVAIGLSGGVDSSVAAYLLKEKGYDVTAVYMKCWGDDTKGCGVEEDKMYAVQSAAHLDIKFVELDFRKEYKEKVIHYFYDEYASGRTPNPDVMCNKEIKFGLFFDWAVKNNFDYVSTGHYARIRGESLLKGVDASKDQSYFLYLLNRNQLKKILFPIGDLTKKEVRALAKKIGLPTQNRPDSMGICFIGEVNIRKFLEEQISPKKGKVINTIGEVIGEHDGIWYYTIGQRHGFKIKKYTGVPLYVIKKDAEKNELIVGEEKKCYSKEFDVENIHWINKPVAVKKLGVRIRHLGEVYPAGINNNHVMLEKPAFGVAPGQSAVFYLGDEVLGGGIIK
jgi:tRNA-specific 2-thiouridylase